MSRTADLLSFAKSALWPTQVGFLIFFVTNRCNFNCPFCFYRAEIEKGKKKDLLSLEEIERFAAKTGPLVQLSLTGGEPFLREDLFEIAAAFAQSSRPRYLTVPTNASLAGPMTEFLERFLPGFPNTFLRLVLSVDAIGEEHDRMRATPGAFERLTAAYRAVRPLKDRHANLILDANAVFCAANQDSLKATLSHLHAEFEFDNLSVTFARGDIKDPALKKVSAQKYIEINDFLRDLPRRREKRFLYPVWRGVRDVSREHLVRTVFHDQFVTPCVAGRKMVVVRESGEIGPCEILKKTVGNLRDFDYDLAAALRSPANKTLCKWIRDSRCKCSFECALTANVAWSPGSYPRLLLAALKNIGKRD